MKRVLLLAVFVFTAAVWGKGNPEISASPNDEDDEIEFKEITIPPKPGPKSVVTPVRAWYLQKANMINLRPNGPQGPLAVTVEDGAGNLVLQQAVDSNRPSIELPLPTLPADYYKITIQSSASLLVGRFKVY